MASYSPEEIYEQYDRFCHDRDYETFSAPDEPVGKCFSCDAEVLEEDLTLDGKYFVCQSCIEDWKQMEAEESVEMAEGVSQLRARIATPGCDTNGFQEKEAA